MLPETIYHPAYKLLLLYSRNLNNQIEQKQSNAHHNASESRKKGLIGITRKVGHPTRITRIVPALSSPEAQDLYEDKSRPNALPRGLGSAALHLPCPRLPNALVCSAQSPAENVAYRYYVYGGGGKKSRGRSSTAVSEGEALSHDAEDEERAEETAGGVYEHEEGNVEGVYEHEEIADEHESAPPPRKRARTMDARAFLDVEAAESGSDEDDEEGQMDLEGGDEGDEEPSTPNLEDTLHALSIVHQNDNKWDEYIHRARRRAFEALKLSRFDDDKGDLTSVCMWRMSVRRGREEEIAALLGLRLIKDEDVISPILSIVGRRTSPGYILVETSNYNDVLSLCNGVSNIYGLPVQVPPDEVASWLRTAPYFPLSGSWVRITKANPRYKGDIAWVYDVTPHEGEVFLLYPPRFDRSVSNDQPRVKGKGHSRGRPRRGPLTFDEARRLFGETKVQHKPEFHNEGPSQQECFSVKMRNSSVVNIRYGFIYENTLAFEPTIPTDAELGEFFSVSSFTQLQFDPVCQVALNNMAGMRLQAGNCVRTVHGAGVIEGIYRDVAS
ncbi:hypothetical protein H0H92_005075, partial [Tricholoma furcatifolium]